jgi:hypothetical protein
MIELRTLNGENIDVNSTAITIELNNSLFNDGAVFKGSFSYPISLALSPNNIRLFKFANHLEACTKITNMPVQVCIGAGIFKTAQLKIAVTDTSFEGSLQMDIGRVSEKIRTVKLTEVPFKQILLGATPVKMSENMMAAAGNTDWKVVPYTFLPTRNPDFCRKSDQKHIDENNHTIVNAVRFDGGRVFFSVADRKSDEDGQIVPYFYLTYVLDGLAKWLGLTLKGDFATHPDVEKIVIYNLNSCFISLPWIAAHDHLPPISIAEFFKILIAFFCCQIQVDDKEGTLDISWKKRVFEQFAYRDWSTKLIKIFNQLLIESEGCTIYTQRTESSLKDEVVIGGGRKKTEIKANTLPFIEEKIPNFSQAFYKIPVDKAAGNVSDPIFKHIENYRPVWKRGSFPLRFLFTEGLQAIRHQGPKKHHAPRASSTGNDFNLTFSGEKGLFEYAHRQWFQKTNASKVIKAQFLLAQSDINHLKDDDIIGIKSENGVLMHCLFNKITFSVNKDQPFFIAEAEMTVLDTAQRKNNEPQSITPAINQKAESGIFIKLVSDNKPRVVAMNGHYGYRDQETITLYAFKDRLGTIPHACEQLVVYVSQNIETDTITLKYPPLPPLKPGQNRLAVMPRATINQGDQHAISTSTNDLRFIMNSSSLVIKKPDDRSTSSANVDYGDNGPFCRVHTSIYMLRDGTGYTIID